MQKTLLLVTCELLRERPKSLSLCDLAEEIGVSVSWLSSLLATPPPEGASVTKVERLYNRLSPTPLRFSSVDSASQDLYW